MKLKTPYDYLDLIMNGTITSWEQIPGGNDRYRERRNTVGIFNTAIYHIAQEYYNRFVDFAELENVLLFSYSSFVVEAVIKEVWRLQLYHATGFGQRMISRTSEETCQEYLNSFVPVTLHKATWVHYYAQRIMFIKSSDVEQRRRFFENQVPNEFKEDVKLQCNAVFNERVRLQKTNQDNQSKARLANPIQVSLTVDVNQLPLPLLQGQTELGLRIVV
jgi:hypothetical protein